MAAHQQRAIVAKLKQLQALLPNMCCADCGKRGARVVRFASVKIGVFLCNQCYAAHRQLGAHLTRGKCVGLDTFTLQDVELLERVGNARANQQYEAVLPPGAKPPPTPCNGCSGCGDCRQRLAYITDKYERRKWFNEAPAPVPPPATQQRDTFAAAGAAPVFGATPPPPLHRPPRQRLQWSTFWAFSAPRHHAPNPSQQPAWTSSLPLLPPQPQQQHSDHSRNRLARTVLPPCCPWRHSHRWCRVGLHKARHRCRYSEGYRCSSRSNHWWVPFLVRCSTRSSSSSSSSSSGSCSKLGLLGSHHSRWAFSR